MRRHGVAVPGGRRRAWRSTLGMLACLVVALAVSACDREAAKAREAETARVALAQTETTATRARELPATGLWSEEHLADRLLRAGVAPRRAEVQPKGPEWMRRAPIVYNAGGGEVYAWIYRDSTERRAVTDGLDSALATPEGKAAPFPMPYRVVWQANLAAVIFGGSETNQDRIALALQAGLRTAPAR
ncbi:MAG: hypothetical protein IT357_13805 [Gemmatimonadaceae bacterium]|nr:hypothetical protein [Gemmatimonadaceae bacterium]